MAAGYLAEVASVARAAAVPAISPALLTRCHALPKIELHAHLNGQLNSELRVNALSTEELALLNVAEERSLKGCFQLFDVIHKLTTTHAAITRITEEVILDFAADNVVYLELRTTPKERPEHGMTKQSYIEAVLLGMQRATQQLQCSTSGDTSILVKLLLSIDRREKRDAALATVQLALQYKLRGVVGVDLSGNPAIGEWADWEAALVTARGAAASVNLLVGGGGATNHTDLQANIEAALNMRNAGLKLTLHAAEISAHEETHAMLALRPDRLGHMCVLNQQLEAEMLASRIPVELCLTSNVRTLSVPCYADHHFAQMHAAGHPIVLCTDDAGVFATSLSREYALAATAFNLTDAAMHQLVRSSVDCIFASDEEKEALRQHVERLLGQLSCAAA